MPPFPSQPSPPYGFGRRLAALPGGRARADAAWPCRRSGCGPSRLACPLQAEREPVVLIRHRHFLTGRQSLGQCDLQIVFLVAKGGFSVFRLHFNQGIVDIFPCAVFLIVDRFLINGRFPIAVRSEKIFHVFFPDFLVLLQQDSGRGCRPLSASCAARFSAVSASDAAGPISSSSTTLQKAAIVLIIPRFPVS